MSDFVFIVLERTLKIRQYRVLKIESGRLKDSNYKIKSLSFRAAQENGEVVSLSDSEMVRALNRILGKNVSRGEIDDILKKKREFSRNKNSKNTRDSIDAIFSEMERIMFIPELVIVHFENKKHYSTIIKKGGFSINGKKFVPLLSGAGMMRRSSVLFIDSSIMGKMDDILNNGRNKDVDINPAKFSSYYALVSSASLPVTFPRFCVVPDLTIRAIKTVDFGQYDGGVKDPTIETKDMEIEFNAFDGQGLITPRLARIWSSDLGLSYTLSTAIIRASWIKGMVTVFPMEEFSEQVAGKRKIIDIYGEEVDVSEVDCYISESMFKLFSAYKNTSDYVENSKSRGLGFGISRVNAKESKTFARSSYQFIQVLNLGKNDVESLCEPTLNWLSDVSGGNWEKTVLYSIGDVDTSEDGWFEKLEPQSKAMLLEPRVLKDSYFRDRISKSLSKKKKDAKIGRLLFSGCYSTMISDPYAQASHIFGMGVNPLLKEGEYYSNHWNSLGVKRTAAIRSPIVHSSEVNVLNYRDDENTRKWYSHISSGIVYPANGIGMDCAIHSGSDFDGDEVCTINHQSFIDRRMEGNPIVYTPKKAPKETIASSQSKSVTDSQIRSFGTKIGFITNVGSSMYSLMSNFGDGTIEKEILSTRLKYFRVLQGEEIDSAKTGNSENFFPEHFVKFRKEKEDMGNDEKEWLRLSNSILSNKRPIFMRWLYNDYQRRYKREMSIYDSISKTKWRIPFKDLLKKNDRNQEQEALVKRYKKYSFFIDNDSPMNIVSRYVDSESREIKMFPKRKDFDYSIYYSETFKRPSNNALDKMILLFKEYSSLRRRMKEKYLEDADNLFENSEQIASHIRRRAYLTISSNSEEIGNLAVYMAYFKHPSPSSCSFAWDCFGEEIVENMMSKYKKRYVRLPQKNPSGTIEYLWSNYSIFNVFIGKI